jgi:hypothetical protein
MARLDLFCSLWLRYFYSLISWLSWAQLKVNTHSH